MATEQLGERVSRLEGGYEHVATKADVADTRAAIAEVKVDVAEVRAEVARVESRLEKRLADFRGEVNSRFAEMDAKMARMENRITLRLGALFIAISGALFAALRLLG